MDGFFIYQVKPELFMNDLVHLQSYFFHDWMKWLAASGRKKVVRFCKSDFLSLTLNHFLKLWEKL